MSEEQDYNPFDSDNYEAKSLLNGRRGVIVASEYIRHNYNGKGEQEATALSIDVRVPDFEKPTNSRYSAGSLFPSEEQAKLVGGEVVGGPKALRGPFLTGGAIGKNTQIATFGAELKSAGFPIDRYIKEGAAALVGADITWKAVEKGKGKYASTKDYPAEFHGFKTAAEVSALKAAAAGETAAESAPEAPVDTAALDATLTETLLTALKTAPGNVIPRGQLSIKVGSILPKEVERSTAMARLLKDEFLAAVPGTTYDTKTIKLNA